MPYTLPNFLTLFRIALIPVFVLFFYLPFASARIIAAVIFVIAAITDWLDGYLARILEQSSPLGAFLDPIADKLLVAIALVLLVADPHLPYISLPAAIIVGREIAISGLREWMAEIGKRASVAVLLVSKVKTALQMLAISLLLVHQSLHQRWILLMSYLFLYTAAALTLWTMYRYLQLAWPNLKLPFSKSHSTASV